MTDDLQNKYMIERLRIAIERAEAAEDRVEELEVALRGLMEYANDPVIPSEHGIVDAPTTEQWRHFYRSYVQWASELSKREIAARSVFAELKGKTDSDARSFPEAANGLPQVPMEVELWAAGCDLETARFVAKRLDREGYRLIKPHDLWSEHKHFEGERKFALRQIVKWLKGERDE